MVLVIPNNAIKDISKGEKTTVVSFHAGLTAEQHDKLNQFLNSFNLSSTARDYAYEHVYKAVNLDFLLKFL